MDAVQTSCRGLVESVQQDISDRRDWESKQGSAVEIRYGDRKPRRLPYPGAPQLWEPLADDLIDKITATEVSMLFGSRVLASFTPLDDMAARSKRDIEDAFDALLRETLTIRSRVECLFDLKNERGMSVAKLVEREVDFGGQPTVLCDFEALDPLEVVVPTATKRLRDADRVTHVIRYSVVQFLQEARRRGWGTADELVSRLSASVGGRSEGTGTSLSSDRGVVAKLGNRELSSSLQELVVWEIYHWRAVEEPVPNASGGVDASTAASGVRTALRRWVTVVCPDFPELELSTYPWKWPDQPLVHRQTDPQTGAALELTQMVPGRDRSWPFVQFRRENRRPWYYDTRGVPEKVENDQREATTYRNTKATIVDYFCKPFLKGNQAMASTFKFKPGESLPDGVEMVWPEGVNPVFDYSTDMARAIASRRVGSPEGGLSSADRKREVKTAREVSTTMEVHNQYATAAVERFGEPLAELFTLMWQWLQYNPRPLPIPANPIGRIPPEVFQLGYQISIGVSGRLANPDMMLRYMESASPLLRALPQVGQFIRGDQMAMFIFECIDAKLARRLVVDPSLQGPGGTAPIEQQVAMLGQMVQSQGQFLTSMAQSDVSGEGDGEGEGSGGEGDEKGRSAAVLPAPAAAGGAGQPGG